MLFAWLRVGKQNGVRLGLLANFFMQGGLFGVLFAVVLNSLLVALWEDLSPFCNTETIFVMNFSCNIGAALIWVLTPGLVEETFKAIWLFCRLRRSPEDLPGKCCFCLPASRGYDCGCWYKLAPTPYHVVLCALASGAGFECLENLVYVFDNSGVLDSSRTTKLLPTAETLVAENVIFSSGGEVATTPTSSENEMVLIAIARLPTSFMHMVWTGFIGFGLARRLFLQDARRPSLVTVLLPPIIAHGLYDYALSAMAWADFLNKPQLFWVFLLLFLVLFMGSCFLLGRLTGCRGRFCCNDSCCCAAGFWEIMFGGIAAHRQDGLEDQQLSEVVLQQTMSPADVSPSQQSAAPEASFCQPPPTSS